MSARVEILTDDQAVKDLAYPIKVKVYEGGTQAVPSSATITVKDPDGTAQVEDADMTVEAEVGTLTYSLSTDYTGTLWENAIIEIEYVVSSVTYKAVFLFDVVLNALKCDVVTADLQKREPKIVSWCWESQSSSYQAQIDEAFLDIKRRIKDQGRRPHMLLDGSQVRECVILYSLQMIFLALSKATDDMFWGKYQTYQDAADKAWDRLLIKYDSDEDGIVDSDETNINANQPQLLR